ncbi:ribonuclease R [Sphingobacterium spiritivorum]|uniref:Ribonuclease R n=1 Tax=Sphingobacterium spiritivorum ATCC 33861 TaxID=525373 RepID=D7VP93_SPHSI|nr:ribonuclease R [Sphingobacterium spiritivorum]EFK57740.1 ribonuclease R [Sphingobacterium spiritivorum ATCC 33861]QQT36227.1 ribonuclease R [Sphingobacterium spiritivorum]WQD32964.1 ribonuclease R [Sphingobacterium spiritivorum]SUJ17412.1 Ribonuclease R [Sphingobacterium spiritivorum]
MRTKKENPYKEVLTQMIVDIFEKSGNKPLNYKQVAAKLNVSDSDSKAAIAEVLTIDPRNSPFVESERGKFQLRQIKVYVTGKVDMTADGSAYVIPEDELENDIFIAPRKLRQALHGDIVKVHTYEKRKGRKKEGEVVEILQRAKTDFTGIINLSKSFAFFIADDRKMLHDIFIPLDNLNGAKDGEKVVVSITEWPKGSKNPVGRVKDVLGKKGENNTEMNAILADYGFPLSFPPEVEKEANSFSAVIDNTEIRKRRDFRTIPTFTIDPADAKDFDDAISFQQLPNGHYEIGVHIADVSHFVKPDTALDKEAFERATSVYLVDRVIPMLPERLSNDLCSLRPNEDRLCFSAVFELDDKANIHDQWFGRTVIHSDRRFSYEEAQEVIENKTGDFTTEILKLNELAYILREKKFKNGAISFESEEVKFTLDENGKPTGVYTKVRKDAHKLIEDFMLLANRKVAEYIGKQGKGKNKLTFVYRFHDLPNPETLTTFSQFASRFGHKLTIRSDKETAKSLNALMTKIEGSKEQNLLTSLAVRSMAKAVYTTKNTSHYGLAFDYYTHFTSPIRRYPDVMVHRLLQFYLDGGQKVNAEHYEKMSEHSSQMEKKAAEAERASIKYKQAEFLQDQIGTEYTGIVSGVTEWGMYVEIESNKCEGMVRLRDITDDFYVLDEKNYAIIGQRKKKKYQLGDEVQIKVKKVDLDKRQIDFTLLG